MATASGDGADDRVPAAVPSEVGNPSLKSTSECLDETAAVGADGAAKSGRGNGAAAGGGGGKDGGGGARGGPKSAKGRRGEMARDVLVSKALSKILRHDAEKEGLKLDREGFAKVDELLKLNRLKSLKVAFEEIQNSVSDNAKQRFALKLSEDVQPAASDTTSTDPSHWLIRANQGHSIALDSASLLTPITLEADNVPRIVVHGTYYAFYAPIVASGGLKSMGRNHIHFSTGLPEDAGGVISGMRGDAEILFYIDVRKSLEDGAALWWLSENGVVLTEGGESGVVGKQYWTKVMGRRQDVGLLWENGQEVAELPQAVRDRKAPSGKGPRGKQRDHASAKPRGGGKSSRGGRNKELEVLGGEQSLGVE